MDASGFVPGLISVSCGSNLNNYTTETLATTYENYSNEFGSTKTSESVERHWGLDTIKQTYSGGQQPEEVYLFVSGDTFYKVTNIVMSDVDSVKSASEEILSKLNIAEQQY